MAEKNFVNYHVLISHSPSCLNRDDMNMQKTAVFGGVRRVRISSQSLKYAMRKDTSFQDAFGGPSIRTRELDLLKTRLVEAFSGQYGEDLISQAVDRWCSKEGKSDESPGEVAVAPWCQAEVEEFVRILQSEPQMDAKKLKKEIENRAEQFGKALEKAIDIALFGRMATAELMLPVDGSLALAHSLTTHQVESDIDWFTAVDDLTIGAGETGAGHLNTQEFSAGVFYRYASLNLRQLQNNLGKAEREKALGIAGELFRSLATVVPQAKQQPFAAFNRADFALVSFSDQPISLANAFEQPVKAERSGGYLQPSVEKLTQYWQQMQDAYSLGSQVAALDVRQIAAEGTIRRMATANQMIEWIRQDGR